MFYGLSLAFCAPIPPAAEAQEGPNRLPVHVFYADFGLFRAVLRPRHRPAP